MLLAGSRLINAPVMGLQTGTELARTSKPIINPANLEIIAYEVTGHLLNQHPSLLRIADVREFSDIGLIVDSSDEFVKPDDIIKINDIYQLHFDIIDMQVLDEKKRKLGKVNGYTINTADFFIQQLSVRRPFFKRFSDTELLVHRTQITHISNNAIIVHSERETPELQAHETPGSYVNPFRKKAQPQHIERR